MSVLLREFSGETIFIVLAWEKVNVFGL